MKISELIERLEDIKKLEGDAPVVISEENSKGEFESFRDPDPWYVIPNRSAHWKNVVDEFVVL